MHRCLWIDDVLEQIIDLACRNDDEDTINFTTAISLATTCRAFMDPALNKIWHTLPEFDILLSLFPEDSWVLRDAVEEFVQANCEDQEEIDVLQLRKEYIQEFFFSWPLQEADWARFRFYAPRIRSLTFDYDPFAEPERAISVSALQELSRFAPSKILPQLNDLSWEDPRPEILQYMGTFFTDTLTKLNIDIGIPSPGAYDELDRIALLLPNMCPNLRILRFFEVTHSTLSLILSPPPAIQATSIAKSLRELWVSGLERYSLKVLHEIGTLPYLARLRFPVERASLLPDKPTLPFTELTSLDLYSSKSGDIFAPFLDILQPRNLSELMLAVHSPCRFPMDECLFKAIMRFSKLMRLDMWSTGWEEGLGDEEIYPSAMTILIISPLFSLKHLTVLLIETQTLTFSDEAIEAIAIAFPALVELSVIREWHWPSEVTLNGLRSLALHCPHLAKLGIIFDTGFSLFDSRNTVFHTKNFAPMKLKVGRSLARDPHRMARILCTMFPGLKAVSAWSPSNPELNWNWRSEELKWFEVQRLVDGMRKPSPG
ncbi:hypothetical protein HGRIS_007415 [Hohenbuehelia grisea]|uniref:Uncharacterized protein n=1 Tax=Hohenbuehelia grisea TaxID=104357 RepID=A0ABR3J556_9AGAR